MEKNIHNKIRTFNKTKKPIKNIFNYWYFYLMLLPGLILLLINNYIPMLGIIIAFKNINYTKGILGSDWVGFDNFKFLFATTDAFVITRNTVLYNLTFIIVGTVAGVVVALVLSELRNQVFAKYYQAIIFFPYFLSTVIISFIVYAFLASDTGFINKSILMPLGLQPVSWYADTKYWPLILVFINTWKGLGYTSVIYLAAITGMDIEYYEAAAIDGANRFQQIRKITLPLLKPQIIILTLMSVGKIFNADFGLFYQVTLDSGALYSVTNVIDTYVYRALLFLGDTGMASAAGFYQSIVGFILVLIANWLVKKAEADYALF